MNNLSTLSLTYCKHIYKNIGKSICPDCGKDTHELDWQKNNYLNAEWKKENPNAKSDVWWSI